MFSLNCKKPREHQENTKKPNKTRLQTWGGGGLQSGICWLSRGFLEVFSTFLGFQTKREKDCRAAGVGRGLESAILCFCVVVLEVCLVFTTMQNRSPHGIPFCKHFHQNDIAPCWSAPLILEAPKYACSMGLHGDSSSQMCSTQFGVPYLPVSPFSGFKQYLSGEVLVIFLWAGWCLKEKHREPCNLPTGSPFLGPCFGGFP